MVFFRFGKDCGLRLDLVTLTMTCSMTHMITELTRNKSQDLLINLTLALSSGKSLEWGLWRKKSAFVCVYVRVSLYECVQVYVYIVKTILVSLINVINCFRQRPGHHSPILCQAQLDWESEGTGRVSAEHCCTLLPIATIFCFQSSYQLIVLTVELHTIYRKCLSSTQSNQKTLTFVWCVIAWCIP